MFTGIITHTAPVIGVADAPMFKRLTLALSFPDLKLGESIAVNGVCLTVAEMAPGEVGFDVIQETLDKTNLGLLKAGDKVHLERAMRVGDRFDGHFVQGHVDGTAKLLDRQFSASECRLSIQAPDHLAKYLTPKGSIALDGVSLTLAAVEGARFEVALIPTTLQLTLLGQRMPGYLFNLEADTIAKTVVSFLEQRQG
jgi:riboflavin synthase